jgi:hypothetical protein
MVDSMASGYRSRSVRIPIVKECPWCKEPFDSVTPAQKFCSDSHASSYKRKRKRLQEQRDKEIAETLAKPWGEYRLKLRELPEVLPPPKITILYYRKASPEIMAGHAVRVEREPVCRHGNDEAICRDCWLDTNLLS